MRPFTRSHWPKALTLLLLAIAGLVSSASWQQTESVLQRADQMPSDLASDSSLVRDLVTTNDGLLDDELQFSQRQDQIRTASLRALRADPLDALALHQLAVVKAIQRPSDADPIMRATERVTRRDLVTEIALIERNVAAGDVPAVLRNYDRAMTVHRGSLGALTSILAQAIADQDILMELGEYSDRPWFQTFLSGALSQGAPSLSIANLWRRSRHHFNEASATQVRGALITQLVARGDRRALDELLAGDSRAEATRSHVGFSDRTIDSHFAPLSWRLANDANVRAMYDQVGLLSIEVEAEKGGLVAERVTTLATGNYSLAWNLSHQQGTNGLVSWRVDCLRGGNGEPLLDLSFDIEHEEVIRPLAFTIPADCGFQRWQLSARVGLSPSSMRLKVEL